MTQPKQQIQTIPTRRIGGVAYKQNPFLEPQTIRIGKRRVTVATGVHVDAATGEQLQTSGIHVIREVDRNEFVKIYVQGVRAIFGLKPSSQRLIQYVIEALQRTPGADSVFVAWFSVREFLGEADLKMSRTTFHRALADLIDKGFIAEAPEPNKFWLNIHLFFNGSRMRFIHEYRIRQRNAEADDRQAMLDGTPAPEPDDYQLQGQTPAELAGQLPASSAAQKVPAGGSQ